MTDLSVVIELWSRANVLIASFGILVYLFVSLFMCVAIIKIVWRPILVGLALQFFIAAFVIKTKVGFAFVQSFRSELQKA